MVETGTRRDGETVKERYSRILYFIVHFFKEYIRLRGLNSSPSRRVAASPRHRFAVSLSPSLPCRLALAICLTLIFYLATAGCGYHFAGTGGQAPGDIKSIAVDVLENNTAEIGLESVFTNAILNEFIRWKRLPIKPRKQADGVLGGSLANIKIREVSNVDSNKTLTSRVTITLKLNLKRVETDEILWKKDYSYYEEYVETGNSLDTSLLRRQATSKIAEYLAEKIHIDMFEDF